VLAKPWIVWMLANVWSVVRSKVPPSSS
jgi:hypothetical protein